MNPLTSTRFEQEKQAYWGMRDQLLKQYSGKWVAIVNGKVVAFGDKKMNVLKEALNKTLSEVGYINRVGFEEMTRQKRVRQIVTGRYDTRYDPPMPIMNVAVRAPLGTTIRQVDCIVDTGADLTLFRKEVADALGLWNFEWDEAEVSGIGTEPQRRAFLLAMVQIGEKEFPITIDCRSDLKEDILGRVSSMNLN
ncbi:MAG: DUF5678 domain-containing protein [candidate division KSB1 bacterium]|nr:DUF5678 domain-containing protein [candidate division KSB1 bacterium]MDZ7303237.1 DUF5678 domain-containing protein [candidate division KSB1 bacterium]MDZ7312151.1 DUF5678 domain-containing protein [candidate division KSB1 bacterium]